MFKSTKSKTVSTEKEVVDDGGWVNAFSPMQEKVKDAIIARQKEEGFTYKQSLSGEDGQSSLEYILVMCFIMLPVYLVFTLAGGSSHTAAGILAATPLILGGLFALIAAGALIGGMLFARHLRKYSKKMLENADALWLLHEQRPHAGGMQKKASLAKAFSQWYRNEAMGDDGSYTYAKNLAFIDSIDKKFNVKHHGMLPTDHSTYAARLVEGDKEDRLQLLEFRMDKDVLQARVIQEEVAPSDFVLAASLAAEYSELAAIREREAAQALTDEKELTLRAKDLAEEAKILEQEQKLEQEMDRSTRQQVMQDALSQRG